MPSVPSLQPLSLRPNTRYLIAVRWHGLRRLGTQSSIQDKTLSWTERALAVAEYLCRYGARYVAFVFVRALYLLAPHSVMFGGMKSHFKHAMSHFLGLLFKLTCIGTDSNNRVCLQGLVIAHLYSVKVVMVKWCKLMGWWLWLMVIGSINIQ